MMSRLRNRFRRSWRANRQVPPGPPSPDESSLCQPPLSSSAPCERRCAGRPETLFDLATGDVARIVRVRGGWRGGSGIRQRLLDMGIVRGAVVRVERHAPLGDPVEVSVKGYYLALRMNEARHVEVERI